MDRASRDLLASNHVARGRPDVLPARRTGTRPSSGGFPQPGKRARRQRADRPDNGLRRSRQGLGGRRPLSTCPNDQKGDSMKRKRWKILALGAVLLLPCAAAAQAPGTYTPTPAAAPPAPAAKPPEANFTVKERFNAQRRPKVTVFTFEDTNTDARNARYGASVEAMLVTFLKHKSQFFVVERQNSTLKRLREEKQRRQLGQTQNRPGDESDRQLLDTLDAYILGSVTLLNVNETTPKAPKPSDSAPDSTEGDATPPTRAEIREQITGPRIEIDAKLLSNFDGHIIAAAQRRGPVACLRSIVERLGIAIEQEFLRPYYGQLRITLKEPENVRFFLTPILLDTAPDQEKPPVEYSTSVTIDRDFDKVVPWSTDPTTYTIGSLLSGWYSLRLE